MMTKQLKAFTILEALISLLIIGLIIGLTYSLFQITERQMSLFKEENTQVMEYNLFNSTLKYDIENAVHYQYTDNQLILKNYDTSSVRYFIKGHQIFRHISTRNSDSFNFRVINHNFSNNSSTNNQSFNLTIQFLNDTIKANYFLHKNISESINTKYFNEN